MKRINAMLAVAACVAALGLSAGKVAAQGRGNFDPAQIRERITTRVVEQMDIKDDSEKTAISDAIGKVLDARMEVGFGGGMRFRNRNRGGDSNSTSTDTQSANSNRGRGGFGAPSPEAEDLQKAIDDKAPKAEIKAKLAKLRESNVAKEAKLAEAQANLQKLLDSRQEAVAVLNGLLK
jgi:hypothetical protein